MELNCVLRPEQFFVCDDLKIIFMTGCGAGDEILAKPFNKTDPQTITYVRNQVPYGESHISVTRDAERECLDVQDGLTGATTAIPLDILDQDVRNSIASGQLAFPATPKGKDIEDIRISLRLGLQAAPHPS